MAVSPPSLTALKNKNSIDVKLVVFSINDMADLDGFIPSLADGEEPSLGITP